MKRKLSLALTLAILSPQLMASSHLFFLGTYTRATSRGIYALRLDGDTGALSTPIVAAEAESPAWITFTPDRKRLYAINASKAQAIGFSVDPATAKLTPLPRGPLATTPAGAPSHLVVDATGRALLAANYGDGYVAAMSIQPDGSLGAPNIIQHSGHGPNPERQDKPHVHSVTLSPDNRFVIVADLGQDKVFSYALDPAAAKLTPAAQPFASVPPGAGARHSKFSRDGKHVYVVNEMGASVTVFDYDAARGALTPQQTISTVPADFTGLKWAAEVRVHPNGKFLYASNRTHDSIAVFTIAPDTGRLALVEIVPSGGKTPRNFDLSPDGRWLVCAHQDSEDVNVFGVDAATGRLTRTPHSAKVSMAVCVLFYD